MWQAGRQAALGGRCDSQHTASMDSGDEGDGDLEGGGGAIHSITCHAISSRVMGDANKFTHNCTVHAVHAVNDSAPPPVPASKVMLDSTNNNVLPSGCHGNKMIDMEDRSSVDMSLEEKLQRSKSSLDDMILCPQK